MKRVNKDRYEVLYDAIGRAYGNDVHIIGVYPEEGDVYYQIQWASLGGSSVQDTKYFIEALTVLTDIVSMLDKHEIKFVFTPKHDPEIDSPERYMGAVEKVERWLLGKNIRKVEQWILDGDMDLVCGA